MEHAYRHAGYFLLASVPVFIAGFWIPYFSEIPHFDATITPAVHVHAILLFSWLVLLVFQPFAIRYRAVALHRRLGKASMVLMTLIVPYAVAMLVKEYHEAVAAGAAIAAARNGEMISAAQLLVTVGAYVMAILSIRRRDVPAHMRYMLCTGIFLLPAGLTRTLGYWFGVRQVTGATVSAAAIEACLATLILFDMRHKLNPGPYVRALAGYSLTVVVWLLLGRPV